MTLKEHDGYRKKNLLGKNIQCPNLYRERNGNFCNFSK